MFYSLLWLLRRVSRRGRSHGSRPLKMLYIFASFKRAGTRSFTMSNTCKPTSLQNTRATKMSKTTKQKKTTMHIIRKLCTSRHVELTHTISSAIWGLLVPVVIVIAPSPCPATMTCGTTSRPISHVVIIPHVSSHWQCGIETRMGTT